MRTGYERVLTARLSDGWYLYNQDLKTPLDARIDDLDRVTFFEGLGSVGDKARRVAALAKEIAPAVGADPEAAERAAMLAKADLVSQMVYEFPELQGVMGRYYALEQGEPADIADAIRDHYKPAGQDDDVPTAPVSVAVAINDKIDSLNAFWAIGKKPTGSGDPFALRRAALGVIDLTLRNNIRQSLYDWFDITQQYLAEDNVEVTYKKTREDGLPRWTGIVEDLILFFHDRLKVYLRDKGHRHDHIDAVLTDADGNLQDDLVLIVAKLKALEAFLKIDDGANLAACYKRAANILKAEDKKRALPDNLSVNKAALSEEDEKALFAALETTEGEVRKAVEAEEFEGAMSALASLRAPIDAFFETVTVNADDETLRANRLALLQRFIEATEKVADFSRLEG